MLEILPESQGGTLGIKATGKVTRADYQTLLIPRLEELFQTEPHIRFLYYLAPTLEGFDVEAMWDDARFGIKNRNKFEKIALVGGPRWVQWMAKISAHFMGGEVKTFPEDNLQEAWTWIKT